VLLIGVTILVTIVIRLQIPGKVEFSILAKDIPGGRVASVRSILISVEDAAGKSIFQRKQLSLIAFGNEYLSEPVSLTKGSFKLTEFIIVDEPTRQFMLRPWKVPACLPRKRPIAN